jgi:hypothetical protein
VLEKLEHWCAVNAFTFFFIKDASV